MLLPGEVTATAWLPNGVFTRCDRRGDRLV